MKKVFRIRVKRRKELLSRVIDHIKINGKISFEGDFAEKIQPKLTPSYEETEVLKRNTLYPKLDFWVFDINEQTKEYIKKELLNTIGLRENVIHILIELNRDLFFSSYDNFNDECVALSENDLSESFVQSLKAEGIIWDYQTVIH